MTGVYYQPDLAWVHHSGYSHQVAITGPGILQLLRDADLARGARVTSGGAATNIIAT